MPSIAQSTPATLELLGLRLASDGRLQDCPEVAFQVWSMGTTPAQVFPLTPGDWHRVDSNTGHVADGTYYAFGYTTGTAAGSFQIRWRWRYDTGAYAKQEHPFEVLPTGVASFNAYIGISDIRAAGMAATVASDAKVASAILAWQTMVERVCKQWFAPRYISFRFDGDDSDTAMFGVPIIAVDTLMINDDVVGLSEDLFEIYSGVTPTSDHRRNPRIALRECGGTIFTYDADRGRLRFLRGRKNQSVSGWFGYVENDNVTPWPIQRALTMLVIEKLSIPLYSNPSSPSPMPVPPILGPVTEEWTDGHRLKYATVGGDIGTRKSGLSGLTANPEIIDTLLLYRGPVGMAVPADWWR